MAVKVTTGHGPRGDQVDTHEGAGLVLVRDGNLFVQKSGSPDGTGTIAVYAPGEWLSAQNDAV